MSLPTLLSQDSMDVMQPTVGKDTSGGGTHTPYVVRQAAVPCRWEAISSSQRLQFLQLVIPVTHRIFTQYEGVENGDLCVNADGTTVRVVSISINRAIGGMPTFYELLAEEIKV